MAEMDVEDYLSPIVTGVRTNFLTWKAARRARRRSVILVFGGSGPPTGDYSLGGLQTGPRGARVDAHGSSRPRTASAESAS